MKKIAIILLGVLLCLTALWGGAYALSLGEFSDWWNFPTFFTSMLLFGAGVFIAMHGVIEVR